MAALILVRIVWIRARDLSAHIVCLQLWHEVVGLVVVVRLSNDVDRVDWANANSEVSPLVFNIWPHVQKVILLGHHVATKVPPSLRIPLGIGISENTEVARISMTKD